MTTEDRMTTKTQPTFLGFNIVCNDFTHCVGHQPCRLYRNRNYFHGSDNVPRRDGKHLARAAANTRAKRARSK